MHYSNLSMTLTLTALQVCSLDMHIPSVKALSNVQYVFETILILAFYENSSDLDRRLVCRYRLSLFHIIKASTGIKQISNCFKTAAVAGALRWQEQMDITVWRRKNHSELATRYTGAVHAELTWPQSFPSTFSNTQWREIEVMLGEEMLSALFSFSWHWGEASCQFSLRV